MIKILTNEEILQQQHNQLSANFSSNGNIKSKVDIYISGQINGNIECENSVFIAEQAEIYGKVIAKNALIYGKIHLEIIIQQIAVIGETAQILENLQCAKLILAAKSELPNGCKLNIY